MKLSRHHTTQASLKNNFQSNQFEALLSTIVWRELSALTIKVLMHGNAKGMCLCLCTAFSVHLFLHAALIAPRLQKTLGPLSCWIKWCKSREKAHKMATVTRVFWEAKSTWKRCLINNKQYNKLWASYKHSLSQTLCNACLPSSSPCWLPRGMPVGWDGKSRGHRNQIARVSSNLLR